MGFRESSPGFYARGATFFLPRSFFVRLEKSVSSPPAHACQLPAREGSVKDAHLRAREGFVLEGPEHTGRLGAHRATTTTNLGIGLFISQRKKTAEPYIRSARPRAQTHIPHAGEEEAGLDGTNLLAGIEAMNGPGHTSIPVRRTQGFSEPPPSDKLITLP